MNPSQTGNETNIKLPFFFVFTSMVALIGSQVLLLMQGDFMVAGVFRVPGIWAAAHLFILGWALMVAMGAMYQLVPVAFLTPVWSEKFGFVQFFVTAIGVFWFAHALFYNPGNALISRDFNIAWHSDVSFSNVHDIKKAGQTEYFNALRRNRAILPLNDDRPWHYTAGRDEIWNGWKYLYGHY